MPTSPKRRMTSQRRIILEELRKTKTHPTADELYVVARKRLPKISLGTVYRNLDQLAESGEILKLEMCGCQKRFDGNTHEHFHARCQGCGRVHRALHGVRRHLRTLRTPGLRPTILRRNRTGG
jgi:Fur family transcriptional regulator, ferric uptake regulator